MLMSEMFDLQENIQTKRGYIKFNGVDALPLLGYPRSVEWQPTESGVEDPVGNALIVIEEKFVQFLVTIFKASANMYIINGDANSPLHTFSFDVNELSEVAIFNAAGVQVTPYVDYDRIGVNNSGAVAGSAVQLMQWLTAIQ